MLEDIEKANSQAKQWRKNLGEFKQKMEKEDKSFCMKCAKLSYDKEGMINEKMATDLEEVDRKELFHKKTGKFIGEMIDYKCKMGHGVSVERKPKNDTKKKGKIS